MSRRPPAQASRFGQWAVSVLVLLASGCAVADKMASPDTKADVTLGLRTDRDTSVTVRDGEAATGGMAGRIGGEGDSIALWLSIAALALLPLVYPASRVARLGWRAWRRKSGATSGTEKELCIKLYERSP